MAAVGGLPPVGIRASGPDDAADGQGRRQVVRGRLVEAQHRDDLGTVGCGRDRRVVRDLVVDVGRNELGDLGCDRLVDSGIRGDAAGPDRVRRERPGVSAARGVGDRRVLVPDLGSDVHAVVPCLVELRPASGLRSGDVRPALPGHVCDQQVAELHAGGDGEGDARGRNRGPGGARTDVVRRRVDDVRRRELAVVKGELERPSSFATSDVPAQALRRDVATAKIENLRRCDHEPVRQAMAGDEADGAVAANPWCEAGGVELPAPCLRPVMLVDDEVLLGLLRRDGDHGATEIGLRRDPVFERGDVLRLPSEERQAQRVWTSLDAEPLGRNRDLEVVSRLPDEGRGVQRRTQLPRQECRCVECLRAAESGELGDGNKGCDQERGGDREEEASPALGRGRALGFRRAPMRPQVREARHILHPRAVADTWLRLEESAFLPGSMKRFVVLTGIYFRRIPPLGY